MLSSGKFGYTVGLLQQCIKVRLIPRELEAPSSNLEIQPLVFLYTTERNFIRTSLKTRVKVYTQSYSYIMDNSARTKITNFPLPSCHPLPDKSWGSKNIADTGLFLTGATLKGIAASSTRTWNTTDFIIRCHKLTLHNNVVVNTVDRSKVQM